MVYENRLHEASLFRRRYMSNNSDCYRGGMEIKILVKQPMNGQVYYKPVCGGVLSIQHNRQASQEGDESRKEERFAQQL